MEAILLAGGLGTRLHQVTGDRYPKSLAEVNGHPFLHYVIKYLASMGVNRFIFALSHHAEMIIDDVHCNFPQLDVSFSIEQTPLGTGGAIQQALSHVRNQQALVVNSDSFMEFSLADFVQFHQRKQSLLSIVCTAVGDVSRFGAADIDDDDRLVKFFEKGRTGAGFINSGIYLIEKKHPLMNKINGKFSFETEVLSNSTYPVYAMKNNGLFFDIGTPDDFVGAQQLVQNHGHLFNS